MIRIYILKTYFFPPREKKTSVKLRRRQRRVVKEERAARGKVNDDGGHSSGLDGELPDGPDARLLLLLGGFDVDLAARESASLRPRQLLAEVQRLGFLPRVKLAQFGFLLLVGNREHASDGFSHNANLGQLASRTACNFGDSQRGQLLLEFLQLFDQLFLLLSPEFVRLHFYHFEFLSQKFKYLI